jgi:TonB family protein
MRSNPAGDLYSAREIALAAGVAEADARAALITAGFPDAHVQRSTAVQIGRALVARARESAVPTTPPLLFSLFSRAAGPTRPTGMPLAVSGTVHAGVIAGAVLLAALGTTSTAATPVIEIDNEPLRFVFIAAPGPGGGGGGGGRKQPAPPPKAQREGPRTISSPLPRREPPKPVAAAVAPPEPDPAPLKAEALPAVVAPIVAAPADPETRIGVLEATAARNNSRGAGDAGGVGSGTGTGLGEGVGGGVGPGEGGGIGGGPYRPGSGIEPPQLLREVRADYTEQARRANLEGEVVLEIVVKRDGTVSDPRIVQRLGGGLDERAVQAVRQWRFEPARRLGAPVDVIVEVSVEFRLR